MQQLFEIREARDAARNVSAVGTAAAAPQTPALTAQTAAIVAAIHAALPPRPTGQLAPVDPGNTNQRTNVPQEPADLKDDLRRCPFPPHSRNRCHPSLQEQMMSRTMNLMTNLKRTRHHPGSHVPSAMFRAQAPTIQEQNLTRMPTPPF